MLVIEYNAQRHDDGSITAWVKGAGNRIYFPTETNMWDALGGHFKVGERPVVFFI